jgi:importin subunit alpha-1
LDYLPVLTQALALPTLRCRTQAAWAIGNIVGDREGYRDVVLQTGVLQPLLRIWDGCDFSQDKTKESFRIAMWVCDNMCRYKPNWSSMVPLFNVLPQALSQTDDHFLLKECCWALARILHQSGRHEIIDQMITKDICVRLLQILGFYYY